jgi:hypothetical protein
MSEARIIPSALSYYGSPGQIYSQLHLRFGGDGRIKCNTAVGQYGLSKVHGQSMVTETIDGYVGRLEDPEPLGYVTHRTSVKMLCYYTKLKGISSRRYKATTDIPGQKQTIIATLNRRWSQSKQAAVKGLLK